MVRLVGKDGALSSNLVSGRLEIYYNGQWGTVCDDGFGSTETTVACRQLGFSNYTDYGSVIINNRYYITNFRRKPTGCLIYVTIALQSVLE